MHKFHLEVKTVGLGFLPFLQGTVSTTNYRLSISCVEVRKHGEIFRKLHLTYSFLQQGYVSS